ncbi:DUF1152 domain-containing protein [Prosthecobacter sp.]|uniref:DUF1152 domain-containing protein n=1 Tax=Prosthecobacter sp. TaxID=1965333 RepID=UPI00378382A3
MKLPFFTQLEPAKNVLIAGAGGGFDVFAGLPLYFWLRSQGKTVHLANWSFSELSFCEDKPLPQLSVVRGNTSGSSEYFPEKYLAQWLESEGHDTPVHALQPGGVRPVRAVYEWLAAALRFDTLILIDGGTDILMRGDECGLGTPQEDIASLAAAHSLPADIRKFVVCLGLGVDAYHGVCHAHFLENAAALSAIGGHLGTWSLLWEMPEAQKYAAAVEFVHGCMPRRSSIVNGSIVNAVKGLFGDVHTTTRTQGSRLFINPLMSQFWAFDLDSMARKNRYLDRIQTTDTYSELTFRISNYHNQQKLRPWMDIPI